MSNAPKQANRRSGQLLSDNEVNGYLRKRLKEANDRKSEAIRRHVKGLRDSLRQDVDDVVQPAFAGSFEKNTFVSGLSDIDVLMIINDSSLSGRPPKTTINHMATLIRKRMPMTKVRQGNMAVTVTYSDGIEVQVLPATRTKKGVQIPASGQNQWSKVLHPEKFVEKLVQVNKSNGRKVIPTVKLVKIIVQQQPVKPKPSGYHIESMAIDAFENYRGATDFKSMIIRFVKFATTAVAKPITDSTGQSRYVDGNLKGPNSAERQRVAGMFKSVRKRLNGCRSTKDLDKLFGQ